MATYGRSRDISASPQTVWSVWADPGTWHEWNPSVTRMDLDGPFADGVTGRMHTPSTRPHDVVFHDIDEGHSYEMQTRVIPGTLFHFRCEIAPNAAGSTVRQSVHLTGPMAFLVGPLAGPGIAKSFDKVLDGLKQAVEKTGAR